MESPIVLFHRGTGVDHAGRTRDEILSWGDDKLESAHDYVQWVFPTEKPSRFNHRAPTLTLQDVKVFQRDRDLQASILKGYDRMCEFFMVSKPWTRPNDHNLLRITRILDCLSTIGLKEDAEMFYGQLEKLGADIVSTTTLYHWRIAVR